MSMTETNSDVQPNVAGAAGIPSIDEEPSTRDLTIAPDRSYLSTTSSSFPSSTSPCSSLPTSSDLTSIRVDGSFLLRAALDRETSDAALRLLAGIHTFMVVKIAANPDRTEAYIPIEYVERMTGLDRRTIYTVADEVTERLGALALVRIGTVFVLAEDEDYGIPAVWTTAPVINPTATLTPGLDIRLDDKQWMPSNECWSRQHRAWRLYLCLIATHGRVRLDRVTTKEIVHLVGGAPQHARRVFRALQAAVHSEGEGVDLTIEIAEIWHSDYDRANSFLDTQTLATKREVWKARAKEARGDEMPEVVESVVTSPTTIDRPTPEEVEGDDAEEQAKMDALRRRVQGDPRPGFERMLRDVEDDLAYERNRERWTGDRGQAEIERLTSKRDGVLSQIAALTA